MNTVSVKPSKKEYVLPKQFQNNIRETRKLLTELKSLIHNTGKIK